MAPATQQRVVLKEFSPADPTTTLRCEDAPLPSVKPGEVLIRVTARPVNPADVFSIMARACVWGACGTRCIACCLLLLAALNRCFSPELLRAAAAAAAAALAQETALNRCAG
jgi:hypothetical protein